MQYFAKSDSTVYEFSLLSVSWLFAFLLFLRKFLLTQLEVWERYISCQWVQAKPGRQTLCGAFDGK